MTKGPLQQVRFYEGQYLRARDLRDLSSYFLELERRHIAAEHLWGVAVGLELVGFLKGTEDAPGKPEDLQDLYVKRGVFFDGYGRIGVQRERLRLNDIAVEQTLEDSRYQIWVVYTETEASSPARYLTPGICEDEGLDRVSERVRILFTREPGDHRDPQNPVTDKTPTSSRGVEPPPLGGSSVDWPVYLGSATWSVGTQAFTSHDVTNRRYVGVRAEEIVSPSGQGKIAIGSVGGQTGRFVLSLGAAGSLVDRMSVETSGDIRFDTDNLKIVSTKDSTKEVSLAVQELELEGEVDDAGKPKVVERWVLGVDGDIWIKSEEVGETLQVGTKLKDLQTRVKSLEDILSAKADITQLTTFLELLNPQLLAAMSARVLEVHKQPPTSPIV